MSSAITRQDPFASIYSLQLEVEYGSRFDRCDLINEAYVGIQILLIYIQKTEAWQVRSFI